ncbi:sigma factor-like helix-turn-helix DNA-binding protein [Cohnella sp. GCM10027633]|uniref:sigma factor-like helix-turn-helix DNA-binding protein n=1 Tax=unclassified Cohnella TaxID=2636738 RepID=UPI003643DDE3
MTWVTELQREYIAGRRKLDKYREKLMAEDPSDEVLRELAVVKSMIADMNYAIEWMRTGRQPNAGRGADIRDAYKRSMLMDMDLLPNAPPAQESRITEAQKAEVARILLKLSHRELQCYLLHVSQGLSFAEIGKELKLTKSSVQQFVTRAKSKVAQAI